VRDVCHVAVQAFDWTCVLEASDFFLGEAYLCAAKEVGQARMNGDGGAS
jgi:hypothetical protein